MNEVPEPRIDTLVDAVLFGEDAKATLGDREFSELERAAALATAALARPEAPPLALSQRLAAAGLHFCAERRRAPVVDLRAHDGRLLGAAVWFGLAAGLAAAVLAWFVLLRPTPQVDPASARAQMLARQDVQHLEWKPGPSPFSGAVHGDIVWSGTEQVGYMTFSGLPPLDPDHRFQLWIFDATRSERTPVDGGLFDVTGPDVTTVVPIDPKLPIREAKAFVVTVEERAGAVVSERQHIVAIAGL